MGRVFHSRALPHSSTELGGMKSFENLNKTHVISSYTEAEDLEAAACTVA